MISTIYTTTGRFISDNYTTQSESIVVKTTGDLDSPIFKSNTYHYVWNQTSPKHKKEDKIVWNIVPLYYYSNNIRYQKYSINNNLTNKSQLINIVELEREVRNKLLTTDIMEEYKVCTKKHNPEIDYDDPGNLIWICFDVAHYIATLFGFDEDKYYSEPIQISNQKEFINFMQTNEGIYLVYVSNNIEEHAFVLFLNEDNITIYNGYGDEKAGDIFINTLTRSEWINEFNLSTKSRQSYANLWGFTLKMVVNAIGNKKEIIFNSATINRIY